MKIFPVFLFLSSLNVYAQLQIAAVFSDNMVLQRDMPVQIWGTALPGQKVSVSFADELIEVITHQDSTWCVKFGKKKASSEAISIIISTDRQSLKIKNILLGDVWVCIGQSNMEWPMSKELHFGEQLTTSFQPMLRLYNPGYAGKGIFNSPFPDSIIQKLNAGDLFRGGWQTCDSSSFQSMSAVGYYFGKQLTTRMEIPIGLINMAVGGAPIETFINPDVFISNERFREKISDNWLLNNALPVWVRQRGKQNLDSTLNKAPGSGFNHPFKPGYIYQYGVSRITSLPIKGILWYQGESNAQEEERVWEYTELLKLMVEDYRNQWQQDELPFYFVQLSSIDTTHYKSHLWPEFRNGQRKALEIIKYSGLAVSSDVGSENDVHPRNKKIIGERLARLAFYKTYHQKDIPSGPLPLLAKYEDGKVIIEFQYTGDGLLTSDKKPVSGFSIDGKHEIDAHIDDHTIVINIKSKPAFVYYGWQPYSIGNLVNSDLLPASTFRLKLQ